MARIEEERIREYVLVQLCHVIAKTKVDWILDENKEKFRRKKRVIGKSDKVGKETKQILREIILENQYEVIPEKSQEDVEKSILKEAEVEGDKDNNPSVNDMNGDSKENVV